MAAAGHFRELQGLTASSIGLGTYPGRDDESTDHLYAAAITRALACGCNVLDTAVAYRHQRSERIIGRALGDAFARNLVARDEVIIAGKAGFLPFDSAFSGGTWSCRGNRDARDRQPAGTVRKCRGQGLTDDFSISWHASRAWSVMRARNGYKIRVGSRITA
jgi:aryl-alcohol dehydrogenase-like predicted oxidoreductase